MRIASVLACTILILASPASGAPQTNTGEIQGVITDPSGGVLPRATVVVRHLATGSRTERLSDDSGRFLVSALPVGEYSITAALDGFKAVTRSGLVVQVGRRLEVSIALPIGNRTETVTVTGVTPLLQTVNAEVNDVIDNRQVAELPL